MHARSDFRDLDRRIRDAVDVWTYIVGLSAMLLGWSFLAYAAIGSGTRHSPNYNLADPTPAAQAYNTLVDYQRPQR